MQQNKNEFKPYLDAQNERCLNTEKQRIHYKLYYKSDKI